MAKVEVIGTPNAMTAWSDRIRASGHRLALVPTMGALHAGHVSLLSAARSQADAVALSIFVNPTQFGPKEDLARYPRDLDGDLAKAGSVDTDVAFVPDAKDMYPSGYQSYVDVREVSQGLCGGSRPGHFTGVATVVCKLLNIVRPHVALFGEKDFQQLAVIRRMVADLNLPVKIVGQPTVREPDGLAMSSRNAYLSVPDRARATAIYQGLTAARHLLAQGERTAAALLAEARAVIEKGIDRIDYLEMRDAESLRPVEEIAAPAVVLVAGYLGSTRLIDNLRLG